MLKMSIAKIYLEGGKNIVQELYYAIHIRKLVVTTVYLRIIQIRSVCYLIDDESEAVHHASDDGIRTLSPQSVKTLVVEHLLLGGGCDHSRACVFP